MSKGGSSSSYREWNLDCKVYIGNLSEGASKIDVENSFGKYGPLRNVWVARNPPGFAFVEFDDGRDAEDACRALDGTRIAGARVRVEMSHGRTRRGGGGYGGSPRSGGRGGGDRDRDRNGGGRRDDRRGGDRREERGFRGGGGRGRSRSKSRSPARRSYKSRSRSPRSRSRSHSRGPPVSRSPSRSPPPRSPRSPPPRSARTPPSRSRSRSPSPGARR